MLDPRRAAEARATVSGWPEYAPTPLVPLAGLATRLGVEAVWCKDETGRFGIGSFKALGGGFAVLDAVRNEIARRTGSRPDEGDLGPGSELTAGITTATASAGNHGRAVAWGSARVGCRCVVVLPREAAPERAAAIASHGAAVVRFDGPYDEAVRFVRREAAPRGWLVVSDTAYRGHETVPRRVMEGYTLLAEEMRLALEEAEARPLTHLFIQAGVGGLSTGVCGHLWYAHGAARPRFIAVEPWRADCFGRSLRAGRRVSVPGPFATAMGGLASGVPSTLAWRLLSECLDAAVALPEGAWRDAVVALEGGALGARIGSGPSGAAGVGALLALASLPAARRLLALEPDSRVGVVVTERRFESVPGATGPLADDPII